MLSETDLRETRRRAAAEPKLQPSEKKKCFLRTRNVETQRKVTSHNNTRQIRCEVCGVIKQIKLCYFIKHTHTHTPQRGDSTVAEVTLVLFPLKMEKEVVFQMYECVIGLYRTFLLKVYYKMREFWKPGPLRTAGPTAWVRP